MSLLEEPVIPRFSVVTSAEFAPTFFFTKNTHVPYIQVFQIISRASIRKMAFVDFFLHQIKDHGLVFGKRSGVSEY